MKRFRWIYHPLSLENKETVLDQLGSASSPGLDFFILTILSCAIATFGLITDSPAVIIGAMLVAPLMSPILGLSLASVAGKQRIYKKALIALVEGVILAIALSAVVSLLAYRSPFGVLQELPKEVLSRTHPTPFDLGIAIAGGAAAAYALAQPKLSAALPGVAISTAIMPPLCTIGIGIALQLPNVALGALLLFLTNLIAISFAGILIFASLGFRPTETQDQPRNFHRSALISTTLVLMITAPLVILTLTSVQEANFATQIRDAINTELTKYPNSELVDMKYTKNGDIINLKITIRATKSFSYQEVVDLQTFIATRVNRTVSLQLNMVPITLLNPLIPPTLTPTFTLGPSATFTHTMTATPTNTSTPTFTQTPTITRTITPTATTTPVLGTISNTAGMGLYVRESPLGKSTHILPEGSPILLLENRQTLNNMEWIEIKDLFGRRGWIQIRYVRVAP